MLAGFYFNQNVLAHAKLSKIKATPIGGWLIIELISNINSTTRLTDVSQARRVNVGIAGPPCSIVCGVVQW